jgi:hypothetical protein
VSSHQLAEDITTRQKCLSIRGSSFPSFLKSSRPFMRNFLTCTLNFHTPRPRSSLTDHPTCDRALTGLLLPLAQTAKQIVSLGESPLSPSTFRPFLVRSRLPARCFESLLTGLQGRVSGFDTTSRNGPRPIANGTFSNYS